MTSIDNWTTIGGKLGGISWFDFTIFGLCILRVVFWVALIAIIPKRLQSESTVVGEWWVLDRDEHVNKTCRGPGLHRNRSKAASWKSTLSWYRGVLSLLRPKYRFRQYWLSSEKRCLLQQVAHLESKKMPSIFERCNLQTVNRYHPEHLVNRYRQRNVSPF